MLLILVGKGQVNRVQVILDFNQLIRLPRMNPIAEYVFVFDP